jgi:hypothetical protein
MSRKQTHIFSQLIIHYLLFIQFKLIHYLFNNPYLTNYSLFIKFKLIQSKLIYFNYYQFYKNQFSFNFQLNNKIKKYN